MFAPLLTAKAKKIVFSIDQFSFLDFLSWNI